MSAQISSNQPRDMYFTQMGFPSVFSEHYARSGLQPAYFGGAIRGVAMEQDGDTVQDQYQVQKRVDAKRDVLNRIENNASIQMNLRRNGGLPQHVQPCLSQRRYANPSLGNFSDVYASRPNQFCGMSGGVLRTAEGQRWIRGKLQDRVNQYNVIDSDTAKFTQYSKPEFAETLQEKSISQGVSEAAGIKLHLELSALLSAFATAIQSGEYSRFALNDLFKFLQILFRVGATSTAEELNDILSVIDELLGDVRGIMITARDPDESFMSPKDQSLLTMVNSIMLQAREYLKRMIGAVTKSPKERIAASRNAVKNLKFTSPKTLGSLQRIGDESAILLRDSRDSQRAQRAIRAAAAAAAAPARPAPRRRVAAAPRRRRNAAQIAADLALASEASATGSDRLTDGTTSGNTSGFGHAQNAASAPTRLTRDFRAVWGARQGAYYGEELPAPLGYVDPAIHQNRKPISNSLKPRVQSGVPTFSG